jgi:hypothetical protein
LFLLLGGFGTCDLVQKYDVSVIVVMSKRSPIEIPMP